MGNPRRKTTPIDAQHQAENQDDRHSRASPSRFGEFLILIHTTPTRPAAGLGPRKGKWGRLACACHVVCYESIESAILQIAPFPLLIKGGYHRSQSNRCEREHYQEWQKKVVESETSKIYKIRYDGPSQKIPSSIICFFFV